MRECFAGKDNSKRLNIYIPNTGYNTNYNTIAACLVNNTYSIVGANITWTNSGTYYYNTAYNVYIYPVSNVAQKRINNGD
jgi:hypothetical protein